MCGEVDWLSMHVRKSASAKRWLCVGCIYDMDCQECECHKMVIDSVHGEELESVLFERWVSGGALESAAWAG